MVGVGGVAVIPAGGFAPVPTQFTGTLDSAGSAEIAVADADAKTLVGVYFLGDPGTQTNLYRADLSNTTHIVIQAGDGGADSVGADIAGSYVDA